MADKLALSIGLAARQARHRLELTQADVAELLGMAPEVYGRLERGQMLPSVPTLRRLCTALDLSADECLGLGSASRLATGERPPRYGPAPRLLRLAMRLDALSPRQLRLLTQLGRELAASKRPRTGQR